MKRIEDTNWQLIKNLTKQLKVAVDAKVEQDLMGMLKENGTIQMQIRPELAALAEGQQSLNWQQKRDLATAKETLSQAQTKLRDL